MMLWSLNINYNHVDECALLQLLNLVVLGAPAERSGLARDGKDGGSVCLADEGLAGGPPGLPRTSGRKGRAGERTPLGFTCSMAIAGLPQEESASELPGMPATSASSQVGRGQKESDSPGTKAPEAASPWVILFIPDFENSCPSVVVCKLVCTLGAPAAC